MKDNQLYKFVPVAEVDLDQYHKSKMFIVLKNGKEDSHSASYLMEYKPNLVTHILIPFSPKEISDEDIEKLATLKESSTSWCDKMSFIEGFKSCQQMIVSDVKFNF